MGSTNAPWCAPTKDRRSPCKIKFPFDKKTGKIHKIIEKANRILTFVWYNEVINIKDRVRSIIMKRHIPTPKILSNLKNKRKEAPKKRKLFILLTRFPNNSSVFLEFVTGFHYTHASIGLEEDRNIFYSFVLKGFIVEEVTRYIRPEWESFPCRLYELEVPEKTYQRVKAILLRFSKRKVPPQYAWGSLVACLFRIPYKQNDRYFCSQFVAEVLKKGRAARLKKDSALYLPGDFDTIPGIKLKFQGELKSMAKRLHLLPAPI